jgi:NHLM bacteriocin system ABC transporter ATP-binding protein
MSAFSISHPGRAWLVESAGVDIFSVPAGEGAGAGPRRFLYAVDHGGLIIGMPPASHGDVAVEFIGVPTGGAETSPISREELEVRLSGDPDALSRWMRGLVGAFKRAVDARQAPRIHTVLTEGAVNAVKAGHHAAVPPDAVLWVELRSGSALVGDDESYRLNAGDPAFALPHGLWLTALEDAEILARPMVEVAAEGALDPSLEWLARFFADWAAGHAAREEEEELKRQVARGRLEARARHIGLTRLASMISDMPGDAPALDETNDPLLTVLRMIGAPQAIKFVPAPAWERSARRNDPIQAICRASRIRFRQIGLRGPWWTGDSGHLLGFLKGESPEPVALLWDRAQGGYRLTEAGSGEGRLVDKALAETIEPMGFMFYKPFPERPLRGRDLLAIAFDSVRPEVFSVLAIALATALIALVVPWATNRMLTDIVPVNDVSGALVLTLAIIAIQVGSSTFDAAKAFFLVRIEGLTNVRLQAGVVDRLLSLSTRFYRRFSVGDLASRAGSINVVRDLLSGAAGTTLLGGVFASVYLVQMWWYSPRLTLLAIGLTLVSVALVYVLVRGSIRWQRLQQEMSAKLSGFTVQLIGAIPKVRVANAEARAFEQWSSKFAKQKAAALEGGQYDIAVQVFTSVLPLISSIGLFAYAGWMTSEGKEFALAPGAFVAFNAAFGMFFTAMVQVANTLVTLVAVVPMLEQAAPILEAQPEVSGDRTDPGELTGHIKASHITFRYREDGPIVLDDVSFEARPGEFVAFVGPSGSGKSTCLRMLLGFEKPELGAIYYDRQDLDTLDLTGVRSQIGVVLQASKLSQGDIFQNIVGSAPLTLDDAWAAADAAGLAPDIEEMPMQMHTVVSEGGSTLSGGQRQRLMIARALVRKPRVILFDEATSALDNRTQEVVSESLEKTNATRIVIAHRLSTIRHADRIYVMVNGRIVQQGTFDELVAQEGMFADLVRRQVN